MPALLLSLFIALSGYLTAQSLDIRIPVVDMRDYYDATKREQFLDTLYDAMTQVGFFAVTHTGVDRHLLAWAYQEVEDFFGQDNASKMECFDASLQGQRGYVPGETAKGSPRKDKKEFFHVGRENDSPANIWPKHSESLKAALNGLYAELDRYIVPLQQAIIASINHRGQADLPLDHLNRATQLGATLLRALHYPALTEEEMQKPVYWGAAHTDIDLLALLPYATEKGLQVELNGQWLNVVVPEDAFVINVGDMLQNMTNGLFVSARHRVVAQEPHKERFSMVLFVHPTPETSLAPLPACIALTGGNQLYAPGTQQEFLWERLLELGIAPSLLLPYSQTGHVERQMTYGRASPQVVNLLLENNLASEDLLEMVKTDRKKAE